MTTASQEEKAADGGWYAGGVGNRTSTAILRVHRTHNSFARDLLRANPPIEK